MYDGVASRVEYWIDLDWRRLNLQLVDKYIAINKIFDKSLRSLFK